MKMLKRTPKRPKSALLLPLTLKIQKSVKHLTIYIHNNIMHTLLKLHSRCLITHICTTGSAFYVSQKKNYIFLYPQHI